MRYRRRNPWKGIREERCKKHRNAILEPNHDNPKELLWLNWVGPLSVFSTVPHGGEEGTVKEVRGGHSCITNGHYLWKAEGTGLVNPCRFAEMAW